MRMYEEVKEYVEQQNQYECKVLSAKISQTFNDLGTQVNVWSVYTDNNSAWWVVEGKGIPMNLYNQGAYYLGPDEVYSFHMGIMERIANKQREYKPEDYIENASLGCEMPSLLFRKLKNISSLIDTARENEDFQAIGVQCREVLIALANDIYFPNMAGEEQQPKGSDFKNKARMISAFYNPGSSNSDYRKIYKDITDSVWDLVNKLTHSTNATYYEASTCVALCIATVTLYENIKNKVYDPISQYSCKACRSKRLHIIDDIHDEETDIVSNLFIECEECGEITEVVFEENQEGKYSIGKVVE